MSLFGCDCADKIAGLEAQCADLRLELAGVKAEFYQAQATMTKEVILHFENERRKALLRKKEERLEREERYVLPAL